MQPLLRSSFKGLNDFIIIAVLQNVHVRKIEYKPRKIEKWEEERKRKGEERKDSDG